MRFVRLVSLTELQHEQAIKHTEWLIGKFLSDIDGADKRRVVAIVYGVAYTIPGSKNLFLDSSTSGLTAIQLELIMKLARENVVAVVRKGNSVPMLNDWPWWKRILFRVFLLFPFP